jgi:hypothetical protein
MPICDYTGQEYEGNGVIVTTTERQHVMSPAGFARFVADCGPGTDTAPDSPQAPASVPSEPSSAAAAPEVPTNE